MAVSINRLALGSVQFGMPYGIANQVGQVARNEVAKMLDQAWSRGIDTIDTAIAYGESEQRLGEVGVARWHVISKLPAIPEFCTDVTTWVRESVQGSLNRLNIPRLRGLLLHRSQQLLGPQGETLYRALVAVKDQGLVEKIGVSIYETDELNALWPYFQLDLVQAPFNILDRRLATSGWLTKLHQAGTEIHVRSIFLQGLLLMDASYRPADFARWQPLWDHWDLWLNEQGLTALQACLGFVLSLPEIDRVVVGIDSLQQLDEILASTKKNEIIFPQSLATEDLQLINPANWIKQ